MNIGERLKEERVRLGYNQADFAAIAGVAKTSQFNYEKGDRSPDAEYLAAIAAKGVDVLYVVTGERRPASAESLNPQEAHLLTDYRRLSDSERTHTSHMVTALAEMAGRYEVNGDK